MKAEKGAQHLASAHFSTFWGDLCQPQRDVAAQHARTWTRPPIAQPTPPLASSLPASGGAAPSFAARGRGGAREPLPLRGGAPQHCKQCRAPPALLARPHAQAEVARAAVRREHRRGNPPRPHPPSLASLTRGEAWGRPGADAPRERARVWSGAHTLAAIHRATLTYASMPLWTARLCAQAHDAPGASKKATHPTLRRRVLRVRAQT